MKILQEEQFRVLVDQPDSAAAIDKSTLPITPRGATVRYRVTAMAEGRDSWSSRVLA